MLKRNLLLLSLAVLGFFSCKKHTSDSPQPTGPSSAILTDIANNVIYGVYLDIYNKSISLDSAMQVFAATPTENTLTGAKNAWLAIRQSYEQSESVLFGPAAYLDVDPNLDTWPINTTGITTIIKDTIALTANYAATLDPTLKGFHAMEYILYGDSGLASFSTRQLQYLTALTADAKSNAKNLKAAWDPVEQNYVSNFAYAGVSGKSSYSSQNAAFQELVDAMQSIASQVAAQKIDSALVNPYNQESYYSDNTMTDLINNIQGIKNVYTGQYFAKGLGLHNWVAPRNAKLDSAISAQLNASLAALSDNPCRFNEAITSGSACTSQLRTAEAAIDTLSATLKNKLIPFINQTVTN